MEKSLSELLPRPDPTKLTTEQLYREIATLKEIVFARFSGIDDLLTVATEAIKQQPYVSERQVNHLRELIEAALQAAKDAVEQQYRSSALAVGKSEASTIKQMDQMAMLIAAQGKNFDDKFSDMKDRINRMEGQGVGKEKSETTHRTDNAFIVSLVGLAAVVVGLLVNVFLKH